MLIPDRLSSLILFTSLTATPFFSVPSEQTTLEGVVTYKASGKPAANVYLYTVKGEEEALTNERGEFRFSTGQKLPVTVYVQQDETLKLKLIVANSGRKLTIQL
ncbi:hypothetical protein V9K67_17220 [Paraflavisolibacter sp. H34]|uniref:hypothetical protein n=1 Tax=Huijunlia imazamoxiresistens TaxID=3127457 RepID=UPI0030159F36